MGATAKRFIGCWIMVLLSSASLASAADLRLVEAVRNKDREAVRALLKQRADVNGRQPDGATALHWAVQGDDLDTADLLIRAGADVNAANDYGITPLWIASRNGSPALVGKLLSAGANPNAVRSTGETALMRATLSGSLDAVKALLARGANVNAAETFGGQTALMWAASEGRLEIARSLIELGADLRARSKSGFTPLLFAARQGDFDVVRLLLGAGADVNEAAADGSVLLVAIVRGHTELAEFLLDQGANPNADNAGYTALQRVAGTWETLLTMEMHDLPADTGERSAEWKKAIGQQGQAKVQLLNKLLAHGANVNARMTKDPPRFGHSFATQEGGMAGATAFFVAAMSADSAVMRLLLAHGANPTMTTNAGTTPLMAAVGCCIRSTSETLITERMVLDSAKMLVEELRADVNVVNKDGQTALHGTAYLGYDSVAQFLVDKGAKLNVKNNDGFTPLTVAEGVNFQQAVQVHQSTAELLRKLGGTQ